MRRPPGFNSPDSFAILRCALSPGNAKTNDCHAPGVTSFATTSTDLTAAADAVAFPPPGQKARESIVRILLSGYVVFASEFSWNVDSSSAVSGVSVNQIVAPLLS